MPAPHHGAAAWTRRTDGRIPSGDPNGSTLALRYAARGRCRYLCPDRHINAGPIGRAPGDARHA